MSLDEADSGIAAASEAEVGDEDDENNNNANDGPSARPQRKRRAASAAAAAASRDSAVSGCRPRKKRPPKKPSNTNISDQPNVEEEFRMSWICAECKEAECMIQPEADQLLICEGPCRRLFHYPCANLTELPPEDEDYVCNDCQRKQHICAFCHSYGVDGEDVFRCSRAKCGLFFHESCLAMQNVQVTVKSGADVTNEPSAESAQEEGDETTAVVSPESVFGRRHFVCPGHCCWTCTQHDLKELERDAKNAGKKKSQRGKRPGKKAGAFEAKSERFLVRCMVCPLSFHFSCIPPTANFHELALLCHEHAGSFKLPELDSETSFQHSIERKVEEKYEEKFRAEQLRRERLDPKKGQVVNPFFPHMLGDSMSKREEKLFDMIKAGGYDMDGAEGAFCLPCDIQKEIEKQPPPYKQIYSLKYDPSHRPPRIPPSGDVCSCVGVCDESCLNRFLYVECHGDKSQSNCSVGPLCGNRRLAQRLLKKCKPAREKGRGWGLITMEKAVKGELVQEYIGEVIDAREKELRLHEWSQDHPNDCNFYIMALQPGWFIDARHASNLARFINHSCDPNCILSQINVGGHMRNGIFALRDIAPGEFLSYDYHFDTRREDLFTCRCGAKKCRGTMKSKSEKGSSSRPSWAQAKARYERDKKFMIDCFQQEEDRLSQVAATVPAAENKDEMVSNGVQERYKTDVWKSGVFLWRNAVKGSDFSSRVVAKARARMG